jgi:hypothetical protein
VVLIVVDDASFEDLSANERFEELAHLGGVGLMTTFTGNLSVGDPGFHTLLSGTASDSTGNPLLKALAGRVRVCTFPGNPPASGQALCLGMAHGFVGPVPDRILIFDTRMSSATGRPALAKIADAALAWLGPDPNEERLVLVTEPSPSHSMELRGDEITPLVMARAERGPLSLPLDPIPSPSPTPPRSSPQVGPSVPASTSPAVPHALTSDTTRQDGLVANVDIAPTILDFFGIPIPKEMTGSPIRIDGTVDVAHLHQLHLDQRRIRLPFQLGLVAFISALGLLTIAALIWIRIRGPLPGWSVSGLRFLILCGVALMIPLMAGGLLPRLTYAVVVPFVVVSTIALALIARSARWPGPMGPFAFLGVTALAFIVVDALFGWRGLRIPLLGGTMFDGARFYGIPNAFLATLLGSSLFVATLLGPWAGTAFLFGAGLFAGFPALGADLGGAATLFLAAGLWWAIRSTSRRIVARAAGAAVIVVVGLAAVVLANRYLPGAPTHIAGFVERTGSGLAGIWHTFTSRLDVAVGQLQDVPAAWIPMVGLVVVLAAALIRPEPVGSGFAVAGHTWRDALIVLTLAGMAAFFANDTGVAAAAPVFLYAATAMAYPSLLFIRTTEMR